MNGAIRECIVTIESDDTRLKALSEISFSDFARLLLISKIENSKFVSKQLDLYVNNEQTAKEIFDIRNLYEQCSEDVKVKILILAKDLIDKDTKISLYSSVRSSSARLKLLNEEFVDYNLDDLNCIYNIEDKSSERYGEDSKLLNSLVEKMIKSMLKPDFTQEFASDNQEFNQMCIGCCEKIKSDNTFIIEGNNEKYGIDLEEIYNQSVSNNNPMGVITAIKIARELLTPKEVEDGKYKIPHKYLYEVLDNQDTNIDEKVKSLLFYLKMDGNIEMSTGKKIEEMYDDPETNLYVHGYMHGVDPKDPKDEEGFNRIRDSHLSKGLVCNANNNPALDYTTKSITNQWASCFCDLFGGYAGKEGNFREVPVFLIRIPKTIIDNNIPIWGKDSKSDNSAPHLLPEFMEGYIDWKTGEYVENPFPLEQRKKYRYVTCDRGSDYIDISQESSITAEGLVSVESLGKSVIDQMSDIESTDDYDSTTERLELQMKNQHIYNRGDQNEQR